LPDVKAIDSIAHETAIAYEWASYENNITAVLEVFSTEVFGRISDGLLSRYQRVIVTADHGSSRLAVLARIHDFDETLSYDGDALDWRYATALDTSCPDTLEVTLDGRFWVVRGYNRFSKSGGKMNELHGGAALEERLVPFIVFTKEKISDESADEEKNVSAQMVEKDGFDI
jgi:hypothetical protein